MFLVGLTGSIGTGKSTVAEILVEHGIPVVDADFYARKGTPELTSAFISLRSAHDILFTKRRNSASLGYSVILQKLVESRLIEENSLTPRQLRKKWENLLKRYRKLKHAANTGLTSSPRGVELTIENWPYFKDMEQILVKQEPLNHMLLSENISDQSMNFEMSEEYLDSDKRFCPATVEDCSTIQVLENRPSPTETKSHLNVQTVGTSLSRTELLQRLVNLHERFVDLYERLIVQLEKSN